MKFVVTYIRDFTNMLFIAAAIILVFVFSSDLYLERQTIHDIPDKIGNLFFLIVMVNVFCRLILSITKEK